MLAALMRLLLSEPDQSPVCLDSSAVGGTGIFLAIAKPTTLGKQAFEGQASDRLTFKLLLLSFPLPSLAASHLLSKVPLKQQQPIRVGTCQ